VIAITQAEQVQNPTIHAFNFFLMDPGYLLATLHRKPLPPSAATPRMDDVHPIFPVCTLEKADFKI
jgi:hypothetical protein